MGADPIEIAGGVARLPHPVPVLPRILERFERCVVAQLWPVPGDQSLTDARLGFGHERREALDDRS